MQAFDTCLYPSKPCSNPGSLKPNGEPHRLCTMHRTRANDAQRRWHSRQRHTPDDDGYISSTKTSRKRRREPVSPTSSASSSANDVAEFDPRQRRHSCFALATPDSVVLSSWANPVFLPMMEPANFYNPLTADPNPFSDEELDQLSSFVVEFEDYAVEAAPSVVAACSNDALVYL